MLEHTPTGSTGSTGSTGTKPGSKRVDRNWQELLQELRVAQTGVQILTGFLLTIPFTPRFDTLPPSRQLTYSVVLCGAILSTVLMMTPVALHRALFHRGARPWLVEAADLYARLGLAAMALTMAGVVWFVLDVVWSALTATAVAGPMLLFVIAVWVIIPARERRRGR